MTTPLLEVEDLTIQYHTKQGPVTAVSNASFTIERGEYFGLVGESGSGKSTLAGAIMGGLDSNGEITSGKIRFKGEEIQDYSEEELNQSIRWKEISFIPQSSMNNLDPLRRIDKQALELANVHTNYSEKEALQRFQEMFETVGLPPERISDYPHQFSGGMQQRVIIALALFLDPTFIIADEPTTALDVIMQDQLFKYLDKFRDDPDLAMLLITHDISLVFESCDSMAVMHGSQVAEVGTTKDVFNSPRHPYSVMLQNAFPDVQDPHRDLEEIEGQPPQIVGDVDICTFADRCPWATEECKQSAPSLESMNAENGSKPHEAACFNAEAVYADTKGNTVANTRGREPSQTELPSRDEEGDQEPLLEVRNLQKTFTQNTGVVSKLLGQEVQRTHAVDGVSFTLNRNEVHGIIGESGCGKSTLLMLLMGLYDPTDGEILFKGTPISSLNRKEKKEFRRRVQMIFQNPFDSLDPRMTVAQTLREPLNIHDFDDQESRIRTVLEQVELNPPERYLDRKPNQLSGGEKQRVSIARALILEPDILVADEPVSMLDVSTQASLLNLLSSLTDEYGMSMLYVSHDLSTVTTVCDRINVMYLGRFVERGPTHELLDSPLHPYAKALVNAVPVPDPNQTRGRTELEGTTQDAQATESGCRFRDRCPDAMECCEQTPKYIQNNDRGVACHLYYDHETETDELDLQLEEEINT